MLLIIDARAVGDRSTACYAACHFNSTNVRWEPRPRNDTVLTPPVLHRRPKLRPYCCCNCREVASHRSRIAKSDQGHSPVSSISSQQIEQRVLSIQNRFFNPIT